MTQESVHVNPEPKHPNNPHGLSGRPRALGVGNYTPAAATGLVPPAPGHCIHKFTLATLGTPSGVGGGRLGWCVRCGEAATYNPMTGEYVQ